MTSGQEWLDRMQIPGRTRAGLAFTTSITQLLFFNDEVKDRDKRLRKQIEKATEAAETAGQDALLVWLAETLDFERLRLMLSIVHLVTVFEAYLLDTVREILHACPQALKTGRQLTYREVFSFDDMESLRSFAIDREVEKLGYKSYQDMAKYFAERFNIDFSRLRFTGKTNLDEEDVLALVRGGLLIGDEGDGGNSPPEGMRINQGAVVEVFATRNILVHNQGIVNQVYLDAVPDSPLRLGELRPLSDEYFRNALGILVVLADAIEDKVVQKYVQQPKVRG